MKSLFSYIVCTLLAPMLSAQVTIGGKQSVSSNAVSLEFQAGNRGIIVPWTDSAAAVDNTANTLAGATTGAVAGTIIYDSADKSMKVKTTSGWKDLSIDKTGSVNTDLQSPLSEKTNAKVSIGTPTATPGILVLEDKNKAMILPKVASPHLNIVKPEPGTMVYDTASKQLAVYNGTVWTFWKP